MQNRPSDLLWLQFGAWIRDYREQNHLSQAGAAQRAGMDRQQWYRIESGKSGTKRDTVISMARAVSANPGEALRRAGFSETDVGADPEMIQISEGVTIRFQGSKDWSEEKRQRAVEAFKTIVAGIRARDSE